MRERERERERERDFNRRTNTVDRKMAGSGLRKTPDEVRILNKTPYATKVNVAGFHAKGGLSL